MCACVCVCACVRVCVRACILYFTPSPVTRSSPHPTPPSSQCRITWPQHLDSAVLLASAQVVPVKAGVLHQQLLNAAAQTHRHTHAHTHTHTDTQTHRHTNTQIHTHTHTHTHTRARAHTRTRTHTQADRDKANTQRQVQGQVFNEWWALSVVHARTEQSKSARLLAYRLVVDLSIPMSRWAYGPAHAHPPRA